MIPIDLIRSCPLNEASGPSILLPHDAYGQTFLITGGNNPHAVFLDGSYQYSAFPKDKGENWKGALVERVRLQVDPSSLFSLESDGLLFGSIVLRGKEASIVVQVKDGGWTETRRIPIESEDDADGSAGTFSMGFKRWRATVWNGVNWETVFDVALNPE